MSEQHTPWQRLVEAASQRPGWRVDHANRQVIYRERSLVTGRWLKRGYVMPADDRFWFRTCTSRGQPHEVFSGVSQSAQDALDGLERMVNQRQREREEHARTRHRAEQDADPTRDWRTSRSAAD